MDIKALTALSVLTNLHSLKIGFEYILKLHQIHKLFIAKIILK